jgi:hypothetical protein
MDKFDLKEQIEKVMEIAQRNGVANNLFFVTTLSDWKRLRLILAKMGAELDKQGSLVNGKANPLISEYSKAAQSAAKLAFELMKMVTGKDSPTEELKTKTCPDFEHMDSKNLAKWCKKFDLDPNDYSKQFLFRALKKKWDWQNDD